MRIGIVGGVERSFRQYEQAAREEGHQVTLHPGDMAGRGRASLEALVLRSELLVLLTDVNSHGAVIYARRYARSVGRRCFLLRRLGLQQFRGLLQGLPGALSSDGDCRVPEAFRDAMPLLASG